MEKTTKNHHFHLPTDPSKRIEMVVAAFIGNGHLNRNVLANYYGLTQLQASTLLRDFLQHRINDVRWDSKRNSYRLIGYPIKNNTE
jgi:hypothetical protein